MRGAFVRTPEPIAIEIVRPDLAHSLTEPGLIGVLPQAARPSTDPHAFKKS
jgi:hypothetical protein